MTRKEIDIIINSIEEVWCDWKLTFKVMSENNLKIVGNEIQTSDDRLIYCIDDFGCYTEEFAKLLEVAYELYKKVNHSSSIYSEKSKYMKLC